MRTRFPALAIPLAAVLLAGAGGPGPRPPRAGVFSRDNLVAWCIVPFDAKQRGPAERAGLAANDVLVALDGLRASADAVERLCERRAAGAAVSVHAFRRDELFATTLILEAAPADTCWLTVAEARDDACDARSTDWLGPAAGS